MVNSITCNTFPSISLFPPSESLSKVAEVALKTLQESLCYSSYYALKGLSYFMEVRASSPSFGENSLEIEIFLLGLAGLTILVRLTCCRDCYFER